MYRIVKIVAVGFLGGMTAGLAAAARPAQVKPVAPGQTVQPNQSTTPTIGQTPWFANQNVRQHLNFNDNQFNQLNKAYGNAWTTYQQGIKGLDKNLTPEQRTQRMQDLQRDFYKNHSSATNNIITDPQMRARYNQLHLQYRGYDAFYDPQIQERLALTDAQRQTFQQYNQEWRKSMGDLSRDYQTDPEGAGKRFDALRKQEAERTEKLLTPQQRQTWHQMIGDPYNFQPNVYFPTTGGNSGK